MIWYETADLPIIAKLSTALTAGAEFLAERAKEELSTKGSIVPLVVSEPYDYPFMQTGELRESITVINPNYEGDAVYVSSAAVDHHVNPGHVYSADVEFGHWWDGWAYDSADGRVKMVSYPHHVLPRPFMRLTLAGYGAEAVNVIIAEARQ